jgi:hypothetical protein
MGRNEARVLHQGPTYLKRDDRWGRVCPFNGWGPTDNVELDAALDVRAKEVPR